jgi:hypothetical protein
MSFLTKITDSIRKLNRTKSDVSNYVSNTPQQITRAERKRGASIISDRILDPSERETLMMENTLPSIYSLVSPNGERFLAVKSKKLNEKTINLKPTEIIFTRITDASLDGDVCVTDERWSVIPISFKIFLKMYPVKFTTLMHRDGIIEFLYIYQNNGHDIILSGRDEGRILMHIYDLNSRK